MDEFILKGGSDFLKISFQEVFGFPKVTSHFGGYDTKNTIEIISGDFSVKSTIWMTTGEIFEFYEKLVKCNDLIEGSIDFANYEHNLELNIQYDKAGHVTIKGTFNAQTEFDNLLKFHFVSDQSYIQSTLQQLRVITEKYGNMKGILNK